MTFVRAIDLRVGDVLVDHAGRAGRTVTTAPRDTHRGYMRAETDVPGMPVNVHRNTMVRIVKPGSKEAK